MNVYGADINNREVDRGRFDAAIKWPIILLLAFMPFAFFTRHAWSEGVVVAFLGAIIFCLFLRFLLHRDQRLFLPWAYLSRRLSVFIAVFQLIPLTFRIAVRISPNIKAL